MSYDNEKFVAYLASDSSQDELSKVESEQSSFEKESARKAQLANDNEEQIIKSREKYATRAFRFLYVWAGFIAIIFLSNLYTPIRFESSVLIALLSSLSVNVLGIVAIIFNYFFPKSK